MSITPVLKQALWTLFDKTNEAPPWRDVPLNIQDMYMAQYLSALEGQIEDNLKQLYYEYYFETNNHPFDQLSKRW